MKSKRSKVHENDVAELRGQLRDAEVRLACLQEETRLKHSSNLESIALLSELLEETQSELESCKSAGSDGRLEQRRKMMRQLSLTLDDGDAAPA